MEQERRVIASCEQVESRSTRGARQLEVVVLSCGELGYKVADRLRTLSEVKAVTLVTTPYRIAGGHGLRSRVRRLKRKEGWGGVARAVLRRIHPRARGNDVASLRTPLPAGVGHLHFEDFHDEECLEGLRDLAPELGIVAGTYILRETVFGIPKLGAVNLHCGKVPEYRGSAPGFWELYNGEACVGVTVHWVTAALDAGGVLAEEAFPLDSAPRIDPLSYLESLRRAVLLPNGIRMLGEVVQALADGSASARPQEQSAARTWPSPTYEHVRELRRRIKKRRRHLNASRRKRRFST